MKTEDYREGLAVPPVATATAPTTSTEKLPAGRPEKLNVPVALLVVVPVSWPFARLRSCTVTFGIACPVELVAVPAREAVWA